MDSGPWNASRYSTLCVQDGAASIRRLGGLQLCAFFTYLNRLNGVKNQIDVTRMTLQLRLTISWRARHMTRILVLLAVDRAVLGIPQMVNQIKYILLLLLLLLMLVWLVYQLWQIVHTRHNRWVYVL